MATDTNRYDIAFCVNDNYAKYIAVTMHSILACNSDARVCFHVFTDRLSPRSTRLLERVVSGHDATLRVYEVDDSKLRGLCTRHFTIYTWYRVLVPELVDSDVHRMLYLDADTVVDGSLRPLFELDLDGVSAAAVLDDETDAEQHYIRSEIAGRRGYFCAGVLLMNLDYWRQHNIHGQVVDWGMAHNDSVLFPDQDSINHVCQHSRMILPLKYGVTPKMFENPMFHSGMSGEFAEALAHPVIVHYNRMGPWHYECDHPMARIWYGYNKRLGRDRVRMTYKFKSTGIAAVKSRVWQWLHPGFYEKKINRLWHETLDRFS